MKYCENSRPVNQTVLCTFSKLKHTLAKKKKRSCEAFQKLTDK